MMMIIIIIIIIIIINSVAAAAAADDDDGQRTNVFVGYFYSACSLCFYIVMVTGNILQPVIVTEFS